MREKSIVHYDLDTFFVSCERLVNSELNGKPILIGGSSDRGVVASCSYESRKFGVRSAMPMRYALRLCPQAIVVRGDMELYSRYSKLVTDVMTDSAPLVEKASVDEFYLDISGMDKYFGCYQWTSELSQRIMKETGLPISFGLSVNKTVAKVATGEGKPTGKLAVPQDQVKPFLFPLSIRKIPMVGKATFEILSRIGIRQVGTLAEMPVEVMQQLIGKNGVTIWKKANGVDNRPVVPYTERKSISTERTFHTDTMDIPRLKALLVAMVEKLAFQLRDEGKLCSNISVKIRYTNFDTHSKQSRLHYTSNTQELLKRAQELFEGIYTRRMMLRLVGVRLSGIVTGSYQINLFDDERLIQLCMAADKLKKQYGHRCLQRAVSLKAYAKPTGILKDRGMGSTLNQEQAKSKPERKRRTSSFGDMGWGGVKNTDLRKQLINEPEALAGERRKEIDERRKENNYF